MTDHIEFDPVDAIGAGAFGDPGARTFVIQARKGDALLSVLVEKEQVALLAAEAEQFLDRIAEEDPEEPPIRCRSTTAAPVEEDEPLFRARLIGIGYDPERHLVLIELREEAVDEDETTAARSTTAKVASRACTRRARRCAPWSRNGVGVGRRGPAEVPALRLPDGSRRAHLPALELSTQLPDDAWPDAAGPKRRRASCCATATSTCSVACRGRRTRRSS